MPKDIGTRAPSTWMVLGASGRFSYAEHASRKPFQVEMVAVSFGNRCSFPWEIKT